MANQRKMKQAEFEAKEKEKREKRRREELERERQREAERKLYKRSTLADQLDFMYNAPEVRTSEAPIAVPGAPFDPPPAPKRERGSEENKYVRNITCPKCGLRGHAPGDRECPGSGISKTQDEARKLSEALNVNNHRYSEHLKLKDHLRQDQVGVMNNLLVSSGESSEDIEEAFLNSLSEKDKRRLIKHLEKKQRKREGKKSHKKHKKSKHRKRSRRSSSSSSSDSDEPRKKRRRSENERVGEYRERVLSVMERQIKEEMPREEEWVEKKTKLEDDKEKRHHDRHKEGRRYKDDGERHKDRDEERRRHRDEHENRDR